MLLNEDVQLINLFICVCVCVPLGQIEERAAQRRVDREEKRRLDAELDADMRAYEPWGRGGAGAPLKDSTGNLISMTYLL